MEAAEIEEPSRRIRLTAWLAGVIAPGLVGVLISIVWRPKGTYFWPSLERLSLDGAADGLRAAVGGLARWLPDWSLYSLPGGLYVFTLTMAAGLTLSRRESWNRIWLWAPMALAWGHEAAQGIGLRPGAADWQDVAGYGLGAVCAWSLWRNRHEE